MDYETFSNNKRITLQCSYFRCFYSEFDTTAFLEIGAQELWSRTIIIILIYTFVKFQMVKEQIIMFAIYSEFGNTQLKLKYKLQYLPRENKLHPQ